MENVGGDLASRAEDKEGLSWCRGNQFSYFEIPDGK